MAQPCVTASWATENRAALAKVRNFSVTLNGPVWKNPIALLSAEEFGYCEHNAYFTVEV